MTLILNRKSFLGGSNSTMRGKYVLQANSGDRVPERWNFVSKIMEVREGGTNIPRTRNCSLWLEQEPGKMVTPRRELGQCQVSKGL